jgi:hypothetical protein
MHAAHSWLAACSAHPRSCVLMKRQRWKRRGHGAKPSNLPVLHIKQTVLWKLTKRLERTYFRNGVRIKNSKFQHQHKSATHLILHNKTNWELWNSHSFAGHKVWHEHTWCTTQYIVLNQSAGIKVPLEIDQNLQVWPFVPHDDSATILYNIFFWKSQESCVSLYYREEK